MIAYAFRSLLDNGAILSFGSDWPGTSAAEYHVHPKYLIHAAVNRTTVKGTPEGGWFPEQRMTIEEAIKGFTIWAAYGAFQEDVLGSIEIGKLADLSVLNKDILTADPQEILTTQAVYTIVGGKVRYKRK